MADKVNNMETVKSLEEVNKVLKSGKLPVLLPSMLMEELDPLEHSWGLLLILFHYIYQNC